LAINLYKSSSIIDSRILVLVSTGQGNLPKKSPCPEASRYSPRLPPKNGALWTNKVLVRAGLIYPWSLLTNYSYEKQYVMYIKRIKKSAPLYLHIAYLSGFKKGGRGQRAITWFVDLCFITTVTILLYFILLFPLYTSFLYAFFSSIYKRGGDKGGKGETER
jgi:hypothetical protein